MKSIKHLFAEAMFGATAADVAAIRDKENIKFRTDNGHPTQRSNTVATYKKFFELLPPELQAGVGLDYSAGLGMGSDMLRSIFGANIESYEPFPHKNAVDITYAGLGNLPNKQYDYIFCSAVLNVVEKDVRDSIVLDIWDHLKPGGQAIIGVRSRADVLGAKTAYVINHDTGEVIDRVRGSYQKGFTRAELSEYIRDLIPEAASRAVDVSGMSQVVIRIFKDDVYNVTDEPVLDEE
jgi:SAM-dependent methyltransferase